jgi:autotransporter-associated beta strand protein
MAFFSWSRWLRSLLRPQMKPIQKRTSKPSVEALETRVVPTQFIWSGTAGDGNWGTAGNWQNGIVPSASTAPNDLVFPPVANSGVIKLTNNLGTGTAPLKVNSISFSGSNYDLTGNGIVLGAAASANQQTGQLNVGAGLNDTIDFGISLGGGGSSQQVFLVGNTATLTINGSLAGTGGSGWQQSGSGMMILTADNSTFTGAFTIAGGITQITKGSSLGISAVPSNVVTVQTGAQLQLNNPNGLSVLSRIRLSGTGPAATGPTAGAILNLVGNNSWAGTVELDSNVAFGSAMGPANKPWNLTFFNTITDLGAGHGVSKEGAGTITFAVNNTYRGTTTIDNGILAVSAPQALGTGPGGVADNSSTDAVIVNANYNNNTYGTLQIVGPNAVGPGLTIANKLLVLNGPGAGTTFVQPGATPPLNELGALDNLSGFNTWTGNVILGSGTADGTNNVTIRADGKDPHFKLTITGVVSDPGASGGKFHNLFKNGPGVLVFTNSNTYGGTTTIGAGTLQIDDSQGLGPKGKTNITDVQNGGTLQLAIDNIADSLTKTRNTLTVFDPLHIAGFGDGGIGALSSLSGINIYYGTVTLTQSASIGVTADPNATNTAAYFTNDYSLTIEPFGGFGGSALVGPNNNSLTKVGTGQLILPTANMSFTGNVNINQGWITVENNNSLGNIRNGLGVRSQPQVTVRSGAALMLDAQAGSTINMPENFVISGKGIMHPFSEIDEQGAIENLAGVNSIEGTLQITGPSGIGVAPVFGTSQLTLIGAISQAASGNTIPVGAQASGGSQESDTIVDTGANSGTITINYDMYYIPDTIDVYYGVKGAGGIDIKSTGPLQGSGTLNVNYGPTSGLSTTTVEIVIDQGGGLTSTFWTYSAVIAPAASAFNNSLSKLGSGLLAIQGDSTLTGPVNVDEGVLLNQNNTGLGTGYTAGSVTTVQAGAALALANSTAYNNGGVESGISVGGEQLVLNSNPNVQTVTVNGTLFGTFQLGMTVGNNSQTTPALPANLPAAGMAITAATETGTTVTVSTVAANGFQTGQLVTIAGITPTGYDGTFPVTVINANTFTYTAAPNLGAATLNGATASGTGRTLQSALQALVTQLAGPNATVSVTQTGDVYNIVYGGSLAGAALPLLKVVPGSITDPSTNVIIGTGIGNNSLGAPVAPLTVLNGPTSTWNPSVTLVQSSQFLAGLTTTTLAPYGTVGSNTIIPTDVHWGGGITLGGSSYIDVAGSTRLVVGGAIDDATNTTGGSDLVKVGTGELTLQGVSSYRGSTYTGTSATPNTPGYNPDGASTFFGGATPGGVLTAAGNQALGAASAPTVQQLTFTNTVAGATKFQLNFVSTTNVSAATAAITYTGNPATDAQNIQDALNKLSNIGGPNSDPAGIVTVNPTGTAGQFNVIFGGSFTGFNQPLMQAFITTGQSSGNVNVSLVTPGTGSVVVQNGASLQLVGNITVAGKTLEMSGQGFNGAGVPLVVPNWSSVGTGPVTNGPTINTGQLVNGTVVSALAPAAGRITSIAVDPTDASGDTIFVATSGGGAFKTLNGGQTWVPIFDNATALDLGFIAIAPSNPHILYIGTGEANNSPDSYAGIGVFKSVDDGHTWTLLSGGSGGNPLSGLSVTKIAVDSFNPNLIYVATSDQSTNAKVGIAAPGVYRFDPTSGWTNLTALLSPTRAVDPTTNGLPGPDDNSAIFFPQQNVSWSDVGIIDSAGGHATDVLYAALGSRDGTYEPYKGGILDFNAIYYMQNPDGPAGTLGWDLGSGGPNAGDTPQVPDAGNIKFNAVNVWDTPQFGPDVDPIADGSVQVQAVYESAIQPQLANPPPAPDYLTNELAGTLIGEFSGQFGAGKLPGYNDGMVWGANKATIPVNGTDQYNLAIYTVVQTNTNRFPLITNIYTDPIPFPIVYQVNSYFGTATNMQWSTNAGLLHSGKPGGNAFNDFTLDTTGNTPHASIHAFAAVGPNGNINNANLLFVGTDGGIWKGALTVTGSLTNWTDINGNLNNQLVYSVTSNANTPNNIVIGTQSASIATYDATTNTWTMSQGAINGSTYNTWMPYTETATQVVMSQQDPNVGLAFVNDDVFGSSQFDGVVGYYDFFNNTIGGTAYTGIQSDYDPNISNFFPPWPTYSPSLTSLTTLMMTTDGGKTWIPVTPYNIKFPTTNFVNVQGTYLDPGTVDPAFGQYRVAGAQVPYVGPAGESFGTFGPYTYNFEFQPSLVTDPANGSRFLYGDQYPWDTASQTTGQLNPGNPTFRPLNETLNGGGTFSPIGSPTGGATAGAQTTPVIPQLIGLAQFQGTFQADPAFPLVTDQGANTDVPGTMYIAGRDAVTSAPEIWITRNYTLSWSQRSLPAQALSFSPNATMTDLQVDPSNSNIVYVTIGGATGLTSLSGQTSNGRVWQSTNGGQSWNPIGGVVAANDGLPDVAVNKMVIDPRTGTLYVATDVGVYQLLKNSGTWTSVGTGMPTVKVTSLYLNQATNSLVAGTSGQGVFQVPLTDIQLNAGGLTAIDGQTQWTGPIVLTGPTTLSAQGSQSLSNNLSAAQLVLTGSISDINSGTTTNSVTVGTPAGAGVVVFGGASTYTGTTTVADGVLVADNFAALGSTQNVATVNIGAQLQLAASLDAKPVILNGDGVAPGINGHNTGALEGTGVNVSFSGPITLSTPNVTIGVASGSTMTLTGVIGGSGNLTKELTGTLVMDQVQANTYLNTAVDQGLLLIESSVALNPNGTVTILDGGQIGLETPTDSTDPNFNAPVTVGSSLNISGSGIQNKGALVNLGGHNTWAGNVALRGDPSFSPTSFAVGAVLIGVGLDGDPADPTDILTITGNITEGQPNLYSGLRKVGPDTLVLGGSGTFNGTTFIDSGTVRITNNQALGDTTDNPIQRVSVFDPGANGNFTLSLTLGGQTLATGLIPSGTDSLTMSNNVQTQLNLLLQRLGFGNITTKVTGVAENVQGTSIQEIILSIMFQGAGLAGLNLPQLVALASGDAAVAESEVADNGYGTDVAAGAVLQLDLANSPTGSTTVNENIQLNATGPNNNGAMENISGFNFWQGAVNLQSSSSISVDANPNPVVPSFLTVTGTVTGPASSALTKIGPGVLGLAGTNTYMGTTFISQGTISAQSNLALGGPLTDEVQTITLSGAFTGTYQLSFTDNNGNIVTTDPVSGQATAQQLQDALNKAIKTLPGTPTNAVLVSLSPNGTVYTVTFVGALAGINFGGFGAGPLALVPFSNTAGLQVDIASVTDGGQGNTIVSSGATLQLSNNGSGDVHISTEQLILNGNGTTGQPAAISAVTEIGSTVTVTTASAHGFQSGEFITISGITPAGYDGVFSVTVLDATHFTYTALAGLGTATLNGAMATPVTGNGALESVNGGNSWDPNTTPISPTDPTIPDSTIILASSATIGVDADSGSGAAGLTIDQVITDPSPNTQLTKAGGGTLVFTGSTSNSYTGLTEVADGTLELDKTASPIPPASITAVSETGNLVTVTTAQPHGFQTGMFITIAGITPTGYDGTFRINVIDATHFTYTAAANLAAPTLNSPTASVVVIDIPAGLQIGDGVGNPQTAVAQLEDGSISQIGSKAILTILEDGLFDPNGLSQTVGGLNMTGGAVNLINPASSFTIAGSVNASGDTNGLPATIEGGNFVSGTFTLAGTGTILFNVTPPATGPDHVDMDIQTPINGPGQILKTGAGRLELDADSTGTLPTSILDTAGDVQVDGAIGQVSLSGTGSVSGRGTIGIMDGAGGPGTPVVGTVAPGDNGSVAITGILHNNLANTSELWGAGTVFSLDLTHNSLAGQPEPGTDYDELIVSGNPGTNLFLGGATLTGTSTGNINIGDSFTILEAQGGTYISGQFSDPNGTDGAGGPPLVYIGGSKFDVIYKVIPGTTNHYSEVDLVRQPQRAAVSVNSSMPQGSAYGQDVSFTATVTIDNGPPASAPLGSTVTFILDQGTANQQQVSAPVVNNVAVFDPATMLNAPLSVGTHTIDATFIPGTSNAFNPHTANAPQITQTVGTAPTTTTSTFKSGSSFVFSTAAPVVIPVSVVPTLTTVLNAVLPGFPDTVTLQLTNKTTGQVFPSDTEPLGTGGNPSNGYTFNEPALPVGSYVATLTYNGSATLPKDYNGSSTPQFSFTVTPDASSLTLSASAAGSGTGSSSVFGQPVTFTAVITTNAPGTAVPVPGVDFVTFTDNGTQINQVKVTQDPILGYVAVYTTSTLTVGNHTIRASYSGNQPQNGNPATLAGSNGALNPEPFVVNVDNSQTLISANPGANWSFNQPITFVATVLAAAPGSGQPTGSVTFYDAIHSSSNPTPLFTGNIASDGTVTFKTSGLASGPHDIYAVYNGSTSYAISVSPHLKQSVLIGTVTSLTSTENPATVGDTITLIAGVTANPSTAGVPVGTVSFFDATTNSTIAAGVQANASGQYVYATSSLGFGLHKITATFNPNNSSGVGFGTSTSAPLNEAVRSTTATTLSSGSPNPSAVGQPITLTATVAGIPAINGSPTNGTVTFFSNNAFLGTGPVNANGVATFTTASLTRGNYTFTSTYGGNTLFGPSPVSNSINQTVVFGSTTTLSITPNPSSSVQTVTLVATVKAGPGTPVGSGVPTGTVTFYDSITGQPLSINTVPLNTANQAIYKIPASQLGVGIHPIYAYYNGNGTNFAASQSTTITEKVLSSTTVAVTSSGTFVSGTTYSSVYSQPVSFAATITPVAAGTQVLGTVTFKDGAAVLATVPVQFNAANNDYEAATGTFTTLASGAAGLTHTISAVYTPAANGPTTGSTGTMFQRVSPVQTTTSVTSSNSSTVYGQTVTITATVTNAPGTAAPTGTVTFTDNGALLKSAVALVKIGTNDYEATFVTSTLTAKNSPHTIKATFVSSNGNNFTGSSATMTQSVGQVSTTTTVSSSLNPSAVGQTVTFSAVVAPTPAGDTASPTGTVQFTIHDSGGGTVTTGSGTAKGGGVFTFAFALPAFGSYTVTAAYTSNDIATFGNSDNTASPFTQFAFNATQTKLQASTGSISQGDTVSFTATVTDPNNLGTPQGTVTFTTTVNGVTTNLGSQQLAIDASNNNTASISTTALPVGVNTITATYGGDSSFYAASTATTTVTVYAVAFSMKVSVTSPANHIIIPGFPFTLTATIFDQNGAQILTQAPGSVATLTMYKGSSASGTPISSATATFTGGKFNFTNLKVTQGVYTAHIVYENAVIDYVITTTGRLS